MHAKDTQPTLENTGERVIPDEENNSLNYQVHQSRYEYARRFLAPDGEVLDYGCGTGYGLYDLAQFTAGRCIGIDKAESIEYATYRYPRSNIVYHAGDVTRTAARFGKFDLIVSFDVIEHVPDIDAYLANIAAQLRDNDSLALISTPWSYRHNNRFPIHNPYHECELTTGEFFARLDPFFTIDEIRLTMGMMARVRRKEGQANYLPHMCIELSGAHIVALEEGIEQLSNQVETLAAYREAVHTLSRRLRDQKVETPASSITLTTNGQEYHLRPLNRHTRAEGHFVAQLANLSALDLPLVDYGILSGTALRLTLYRADVPLAQVTLPALLLPEDQPLRFHFPAIPDTSGVAFRWMLETVAEEREDGPVGIWCNASGQPLAQEYYRRYQWEGSPKYSTITEWIAANPSPWRNDWPILCSRASLNTTGKAKEQSAWPNHPRPLTQRLWPPIASLWSKARLALQHFRLSATVGKVLRYLRWRLNA